MSGSVYVIYVRVARGLGEFSPEIISSIAQSEELAKLICRDMRNNGYRARYQSVQFWEDNSLEFWLKRCATQQSSM